jgi:type IV secretory pathway protease TraF
MIKRCVARSRRRLEVRGDNEAVSVDSRHFGAIPANAVAYLVVPSRPETGKKR